MSPAGTIGGAPRQPRLGVSVGRQVALHPAGSLFLTGDRSTDDGKTWTTQLLQIEARCIGPSRSLGPLAPAKK